MNHRLKLLSAAISCSAITVALTGCGLGVSGDAAKSTPIAAAHLIGGSVHGGQQPVSGSTVKMWAAGVAGTYGTAPTLIATTTSDGSGNFGFNSTLGVSPCTTGQFLYLTATGGNSGSGANTSLAMLTALPNPCSAATGSLFLNINEVTTVAAVTALQQFMSISATGTPWSIGAPATNTVGLANAFLTVGTLVNITTGTSASSKTSNVVTSTAQGQTFTTTVNPDFTRLNTLADIISSCINSAGGNACSSLFSDTTPGASPAPVDTIQVAYYLATNAAGLTMNAHGNPQGSPFYLCTTYVTATAPFQPTLPCSTTAFPTDWAINVGYTTVNATPAGAVTVNPNSVAIDGAGNVWTAVSSTATGNGAISELNVLGQVLVAPVTTTNISATSGWMSNATVGTNNFAFGLTRPYGLAIDTAGNAWATSYYSAAITNTSNTAANGAGTYEDPVVQVTPAGVSTGYLVASSSGALAIDGANNLYMNGAPSAGPGGTSRFYVTELVAAGTPAYSTFYTGVGRGTGIYAQLAVDQSTAQYAIPFAGACSATILRTDTAIQANNGINGSANTGTATVALASAAPTTCVLAGAPDAKGNIWGTTATYLEYIDIANGTVATGTTTTTPLTTQIPAGTTTAGVASGLTTPTGVAIDGLGNVWVANTASAASGGVSEFTPTTTGTTTTVVSKSPGGTGVYGFGSANGYTKPVGVVIDPSGNLWLESSGSTLNFLVGLAAPVVTPTSLALKNIQLGLRP